MSIPKTANFEGQSVSLTTFDCSMFGSSLFSGCRLRGKEGQNDEPQNTEQTNSELNARPIKFQLSPAPGCAGSYRKETTRAIEA